MHIFTPTRRHAVSRAVIAVVVILVIVVGGAGAYVLSTGQPGHTTTGSSTGTTTSSTSQSTTQSTTSTSTTQSTTPVGTVPSSITYETVSTVQFLDPQVSYDIYGASVEQNIYEPLVWFAGTNGVNVIPWLAKSVATSNGGHTFTATLRSGVKFADGETLNSSDVYFSYNRLLVMDGSAPLGHGTQASWIMQQLENTSLSTTLCCSQTYGNSYVSAVLKQDFVSMPGPLSVQLNIIHPNAALLYLLGNLWANIVAPDYTMQHDLALWSQSSLGYTLPFPTLHGNFTQMADQYFDDYSATCNSGATPKGCAATYLDSSTGGSLAGSGPYTVQSVDTASSVVTLQKNPNYWGGPNGTLQAQIPKVVYKYVPDQTTREIDLQNAASSGQAMVIDVATTNIYDVANRNAWLNQHQLTSSLTGVTIYGPYTQYATTFIPLDTNVTNPFTGTFYSFQPFADLRFRQAVADSVDLNSVNQNVNNNLGTVANELEPPGIPPTGAYNSSLKTTYSFSPGAVQNLLLSAMMHPITQFHTENGAVAAQGLFNNTFGCAQLNSNNQCAHPVPATFSLVYAQGDLVDQAILGSIAQTINNVSAVYNMGLQVSTTPLPCGQMTTEAFSGQVYGWAEACFGWYDDYPWSLDFLGPILSPGGIYTAPGGWNLNQMGTYWNQAQAASAAGDQAGVVAATNKMAALSNKDVSDIWTFYPDIYMVMTSNVHGFYFNPAIYTTGEPQYFAYLY